MKANELMIGDWVWYDKQPYQIRQLGIFGENRDGDSYPAVCVGRPNGIGLMLERNEIEPIPLTPEILERNEFIKFAGQYVLKADKEPFIHLISLDNMPNANGSMLVAIKVRYINAKIAITYVHELQHALKLCGIEKEIKL